MAVNNRTQRIAELEWELSLVKMDYEWLQKDYQRLAEILQKASFIAETTLNRQQNFSRGD